MINNYTGTVLYIVRECVSPSLLLNHFFSLLQLMGLDSIVKYNTLQKSSCMTTDQAITSNVERCISSDYDEAESIVLPPDFCLAHHCLHQSIKAALRKVHIGSGIGAANFFLQVG